MRTVESDIVFYLIQLPNQPVSKIQLIESIRNAAHASLIELPQHREKSLEDLWFITKGWTRHYLDSLEKFATSCNFYLGKDEDFYRYHLQDTTNFNNFLYILNLFASIRTIGLNLSLASAQKDLEDYEKSSDES